MRWGVLGALAAGLTGGCRDEVKVPPPPDVTSLVAAYDAPTGELTAETIGAVQLALEDELEVLASFCGWQEGAIDDLCSNNACNACSGLDPLSQAFRSVSNSSDGSEDFEDATNGLDGFARLTSTCPGPGRLPTYDAAKDGYVVLTIGFKDGGFDPAFGGKFVDCQLRVDDAPVTANLDLAFALRRRFLPKDLKGTEPIVRITGTIDDSAGSSNVDVSVRFSIVSGADFAFSFEVPDVGNMVFISGLSGIGIQAANGRFSCESSEPAQTLKCRNPSTGETVP
jgi:hypothetical protein